MVKGITKMAREQNLERNGYKKGGGGEGLKNDGSLLLEISNNPRRFNIRVLTGTQFSIYFFLSRLRLFAHDQLFY